MARQRGVLSLLRALGTVSARRVRSLGSIGGQNLFVFLVPLSLQPESAGFFVLILIAVLLIPLSTDPLEAIPVDRLATWPIAARQWTAIRAASLLLSPVSWIAILLTWSLGWRAGALALALGAAAHFLTRVAMPGGGWLRRIPAPPGALGAIVRLQWRAMLRTLDPYVAFVLSASVAAYRLSGRPLDPQAIPVLSAVVTLALSTHTQVLFTIDGPGAGRFAQMPIRGWRILLAKDLAFLSLLAVLLAPLDMAAGLIAGLASLAIGHHVSVLYPLPQTPWRFTMGAIFPWGVFQAIAIFAIGNTLRSAGLPLIAGITAAWTFSLFWYGWHWDRAAISESE